MIEYVISEEDRLVWAWMSGANHYDDLATHYALVLRDPRYQRTMDAVFHLDAGSDGPILGRLPEVRALVELVAQCHDRVRWAVVMSGGLKRIVLEFLLRDADLRLVTLRFFNDQTDAIAWLNNGRSRPITRQSPTAPPA